VHLSLHLTQEASEVDAHTARAQRVYHVCQKRTSRHHARFITTQYDNNMRGPVSQGPNQQLAFALIDSQMWLQAANKRACISRQRLSISHQKAAHSSTMAAMPSDLQCAKGIPDKEAAHSTVRIETAHPWGVLCSPCQLFWWRSDPHLTQTDTRTICNLHYLTCAARHPASPLETASPPGRNCSYAARKIRRPSCNARAL
jgi:hypothetical protein